MTTSVIDNGEIRFTVAGFKKRFQTILKNFKTVLKISLLIRNVYRHQHLMKKIRRGYFLIFIRVKTYAHDELKVD